MIYSEMHSKELTWVPFRSFPLKTLCKNKVGMQSAGVYNFLLNSHSHCPWTTQLSRSSNRTSFGSRVELMFFFQNLSHRHFWDLLTSDLLEGCPTLSLTVLLTLRCPQTPFKGLRSWTSQARESWKLLLFSPDSTAVSMTEAERHAEGAEAQPPSLLKDPRSNG